MNDGITRSGSFGPAAELAAAHTEIERLKAWSNEQIAKLTKYVDELERALYQCTNELLPVDEAQANEADAIIRAEAARGLLQRTFCYLPSGSKIEWAVGVFLADEERAKVEPRPPLEYDDTVKRLQTVALSHGWVLKSWGLVRANPPPPGDDEWKELDPER